MEKVAGKSFLKRLYSLDAGVSKDAELAKLIGKSQSIVSEWKRTDSIPLGRCVEIAELLNLDLDHLLGRESTMGEIVYYGDTPVSAGGGASVISEQPTEIFKMNKKQIKAMAGVDNVIMLPVIGDSMLPTMRDGDIIMAKKQDAYTKTGIYIIRHNGEMLVKRIKKNSNQYQLISDNKEYPPIEINPADDFAIIGKAVKKIEEI